MKTNSLRIVITVVIIGTTHYVLRKRFTKDFTYEFEYTTDINKSMEFHSYAEACKDLKWAETHNRPHQVEDIFIQLPVMVASSSTLN